MINSLYHNIYSCTAKQAFTFYDGENAVCGTYRIVASPHLNWEQKMREGSTLIGC